MMTIPLAERIGVFPSKCAVCVASDRGPASGVVPMGRSCGAATLGNRGCSMGNRCFCSDCILHAPRLMAPVYFGVKPAGLPHAQIAVSAPRRGPCIMTGGILQFAMQAACKRHHRSIQQPVSVSRYSK